MEMDSWKLTHSRTMFPWIWVFNKHFFGYEVENIFSLGLPRCHITRAKIRAKQNRERERETRIEPVVVQSEWSKS
jgi:N-glycosylase/DNA lyase